MRILDIGILAEVFSTLRCNECNNTLVLYEDQWKHGWQTFFRVKCQRCHLEHATFLSHALWTYLATIPVSMCLLHPMI